MTRTALSFLLLFWLSAPAAAQDPPLTVDEAIAQALRLNPGLRAVATGEEAAEARVRQARAGYLPQVSGSAFNGQPIKGDTVNALHEWMDPRYLETHAFGTPSEEERERPPMWRFWRVLPPEGRIGIFFGSWYTDPIISRVYGRTGDAELEELHSAGVRGVRFNFVKRLVDVTPEAALLTIAERIRALGWHVVVYFEAADLGRLRDFLGSLPTIVVVDHMGRPDVSRDPAGPEFGLFLRLLRDNDSTWSKVSCPERLSRSGPPDYRDVVPFARRVVGEFPDRVLWGTDWPHPNMKSHMPDDGKLVDFIPGIAPTAELQRKLLVDNPMRLYWAEETR